MLCLMILSSRRGECMYKKKKGKCKKNSMGHDLDAISV